MHKHDIVYRDLKVRGFGAYFYCVVSCRSVDRSLDLYMHRTPGKKGLADIIHLLYIHKKKQPENLLLDADGHVRITDFGLSKGVSDRLIH